LFADAPLNALEDRAVQANQNLKAAVARVEEARSTARISKSDLFPSVNFDPSYNRQRYSPAAEPGFGNLTANTFSTPLDLSYEVDLWGRVRRSFEGARADAQATLAAYYNVLLTLQADVADNYFGLRALDAEIATVTSTVA
jgi:multidrug efflux system outer membrane protein